MRALAICLALLSSSAAVHAQEDTSELSDAGTRLIGIGRQFNNDYFGDNQDRWRTGSYAISIVTGQGWDGARPDQIGSILEYRLRSEIMAPSALSGAGSNDRAYVGALSLGVHSHFSYGSTDVSVGADLVATGPSTGMSGQQQAFHELFSLPSLSNAVETNQVADAVHPSATLELGWPVQTRTGATLRPFVEAQSGVEQIARVGVDVFLGDVGHSDLLLRDVPTGQLYRGVEGDALGVGYVLGVDYAMVGASAYFPDSFGTVAADSRTRARAGVHWQIADEMSFFYGMTWLSEEYVGQPEGQILGSMKLNFNF